MKLEQSLIICSAFLVAGSLAASVNLNHNTRLGTTLSVKVPIDAAKKYHLGWSVDKEKEEITFEVEVETKGYVGFGISPNGAMTGADLFIAGVYDDGEKYSGDYHGTRNGMPTLDKHQDWVLLDAKENDTHTFLKFSRLLDTCDPEDFPIKGDTSRVVWSYGATDEIEHHAERGTESANFFLPEQPWDASDLKNFTTMKDMIMSSEDTSYWCTLHKGPTLDKKQHVVGFDVYLPTPLAEQYTHHINFYRCTPPDGEDNDEFFSQWVGGVGGECYGDGKDIPFSPYCVNDMIFVWAKGGKRMIFPDDVGYPIGETPGSTYYMLEVHYDNPKKDENVKFATGLTTFYTPNLRKIDAGPMVTGHQVNSSLVIPPQTKDFKVIGHCASECTKTYLPEDGIYIFNSLLHAHLSGRKLKFRHFRNGEELPWIDHDDLYDFNFQQNKPLTEFVKVLPGDHLTYECMYDSTWNEKKEAVVAGYSSRDEMCEGVIWYYPKIDIIRCQSLYPIEKGMKELGIEAYHRSIEGGFPKTYIDEPESMRGPYIQGISFNRTWTEESVKELEENRVYGEHTIACGNVKGVVKYPEIRQEYVPDDKCKKSGGGDSSATMIGVSGSIFPVMILLQILRVF